MAEITILSRGHVRTGNTTRTGGKGKNDDNMKKTAAPFAEMLAMFFPVQAQGLQDRNAAAAPADSKTQQSRDDKQAVAGISSSAAGSGKLKTEPVGVEATQAKGTSNTPENAEAGEQEAQQESNVTANTIAISEDSESLIGIAGATDAAGASGAGTLPGTENTAMVADLEGTAGSPETGNASENSKLHSFSVKEAANEAGAQLSAEQGPETQENVSTALAGYQQAASEPGTVRLQPDQIEAETAAKLKPADLLHEEQTDLELNRPAFTRSMTKRGSFTKTLSGERQIPNGMAGDRAGQITSHAGSDTKGMKSGKSLYEQQQEGQAFTLPGTQQIREYEQPAVQTEQTAQNEKSIGHSIIEQMIDKMTLSDRGSEKELIVHLKPDSLGTVIIRLLEDKGITAVKIITSLPETRDLINSQIPALKQHLADRGLSFQELDVVHDGSSFLQKQADSGSNPDHRGNAGYTWLPAVHTGRESGTEQAAGLELQRMLYAGRINYLV